MHNGDKAQQHYGVVESKRSNSVTNGDATITGCAAWVKMLNFDKWSGDVLDVCLCSAVRVRWKGAKF